MINKVEIVSCTDAPKIDQAIILETNLSIIQLVERAGWELYSNKNIKAKVYFIAAYIGNNGADGLALASIIAENEMESLVLIYIPIGRTEYNEKATISNKHFFNKCSGYSNIKIYFLNEFDFNLIESSEVVFDCIFGTGLNKDINIHIQELIKHINNNNCDKKIISCDVPSGLQNLKQNKEFVIKSDLTISFITYKKEMLENNASNYIGELKIVNLSFQKNEIQKFLKTANFCLNHYFIKSVSLPKREDEIIKQSFEKTVIFAGSEEYPSAGTIVANSVLSAGSGLVYLINNSNAIFNYLYNEIIILNLNKWKNENKNFTKYGCNIIFGPGMGNNEKTKELLQGIIKNNEIKKIVIDADGINVLDDNLLKQLKNRAIITPHIYEFAKLLKCDPKWVLKYSEKLVFAFAKKYGIIVLLKSHRSIISDGNSVFINSTGNPYMASPGMGDSLSGIIGGLLSQKHGLLESTIIGCYSHGLTGDQISKKEKPVLAHRIYEELPKIMNTIFEHKYEK